MLGGSVVIYNLSNYVRQSVIYWLACCDMANLSAELITASPSRLLREQGQLLHSNGVLCFGKTVFGVEKWRCSKMENTKYMDFQ